MSFGDESEPSPFFDPLTPRRNVIPLRPARDWGPPARACSKCSDATREPGTLCKACRAVQPAVSASFVQSTVADAIRNLEREQERAAPLALPLQQAFASMRKAFDSLEPLIQSLHVGIVRTEAGEFYAYPYATTERLGPFGTQNLAEHALVERALEFGNWDTEQEG